MAEYENNGFQLPTTASPTAATIVGGYRFTVDNGTLYATDDAGNTVAVGPVANNAVLDAEQTFTEPQTINTGENEIMLTVDGYDYTGTKHLVHIRPLPDGKALHISYGDLSVPYACEFAIEALGRMEWGPGGTSFPADARDVCLRRTGTNALEIDDNAGGDATLNVVGTLQQDGIDVATMAQRTPQNYFMNGSGRIWQRFGNPGAAKVISDGDYGPDRCKGMTNGSTLEMRRAAGDTQTYCIRLIQREATARYLGMVQYWETGDCRHLQGQTVTFSLRVRCSVAVDVHAGMLQWDGTANTLPNDPWSSWPGGWVTDFSLAAYESVSLAANTWTDLQVTTTLNSTFQNLAPMLRTGSAVPQNAELEFEAIKVERGNIATPFEAIPIASELAMCQRYCYALAPGVDGTVVGAATRKGTFFIVCAVAIPYLRTVPTFSHNVTAWDSTNAAATGTEIGGSSWVDADRWEILNGGTLQEISGFSAGLFAQIQARATTSFDGNPGDAGDLRVGKDVLFVWDAEL